MQSVIRINTTMSEEDPTIRMLIGSYEFDLKRTNSEIFHFMGALAVYNHLFILEDETEDVKTGRFIPQELIGKEPFDQVMGLMIENGYPVRLNQLEVSETDAANIERILKGNDADEIPNWLPEV